MSAEQSGHTPNKDIIHATRFVLFSGIAFTSTSATCLNPLFAIPAVGAYIGMINEARHIPSLNNPTKKT